MQIEMLFTPNLEGGFWASSVKILVFPSPIGYIWTSFGFSLLIGGMFLDSSKTMDIFHEVLIFDWLFLKLNWFIYNYTKYDI